MALQEEPKNVAVINDLVIFNSNYLIKSCARMQNYVFIYSNKNALSCPGLDTKHEGPPIYLSPLGTAVLSFWITCVSQASKVYAPSIRFFFPLTNSTYLLLSCFFCNNISHHQAYLIFQSQTRSKEKCTYFTVAQ